MRNRMITAMISRLVLTIADPTCLPAAANDRAVSTQQSEAPIEAREPINESVNTRQVSQPCEINAWMM